MFNTNNVNCSRFCKCNTYNLDDVVGEYAHMHSSLMGKQYRSDVNGNFPDPYIGFFGIALSVLKTIVKISCVVDDGRNHDMSEFLNGADLQDYTALNVKCPHKEQIVWDLPTWRTTINMFGNQNCRIKSSPNALTKDIKVPLNLWMMEIYGGDKDLIENLDLTYASNVVSFVVSDSELASIPKTWSESYMLSAITTSLQRNGLKEYGCEIAFAGPIDTLNLAKNELVRFPKCLLNPNNFDITFFSLAENKIDDISALFTREEHERAPKIKIIDLSKNRIVYLDAFIDMPNLLKLDLSHNKIGGIESGIFKNINNLEFLSLANNQIDTLAEDAFLDMLNLKTLDLSGNKLVQVMPTMVPVFTSDLVIHLQNNALEHPPFGDCGTNDTHFLYTHSNYQVSAGGNPFRCDCSALPVTKCMKWLEMKNLDKQFFNDVDDFKCNTPSALNGKSYTELNAESSCIYTDECPAGCSCTLVGEQTMVVNCSHRGMKNIPDKVPILSSPNVKLYLNNNQLQNIGYRPYFKHLAELHLHSCRISTVTPAAMTALQHIKVLTLHGNRIERLPQSMSNLSFEQLENLTLHDNEWSCSSDQLWLPKWMSNHEKTLWMPERIVCNSLINRPLITLSENNIRYKDFVLAIFAMVLASAISCYIYRKKLNELMFIKFGIRMSNVFNYGDVYSLYDAFVFYSQHDYKWVVETLVCRLEEGAVRYKLCLHFRDFPQNEIAMDNIPWAVRLSRCSILLLTKQFMKTEWMMVELRDTLQQNLLSDNRLIIIVAHDVTMAELSSDLQDYMKDHQFLRMGEKDFWSKLEFYLPPPRKTLGEKLAVASQRGGAGDQHVKRPEVSAPEDQSLSMSAGDTLSKKPLTESLGI